VAERQGRANGPAPTAVPFSVWLREIQAALAEEAPADVPCGACNACCRTSHFIHVRPEEKRALARIPRRVLFPAPDLPPGNLVMGYDREGRCPMLVDGRCTIYADRPIACRTYDCRIYAATGVAADRGPIAERVRLWEFTYASREDRERHAAVTAAVRFVGDHPESLPSEAVRHDPLRVAVLAIAVHERFLPNKILLLADGGAGQKTLALHNEFIGSVTPIDGKATAYVCENYVCQLPTSDLATLVQLLGPRQEVPGR